MNFREWLLNNEAVVATPRTKAWMGTPHDPHDIDERNIDYKIYKNPTHEEFKELIKLIKSSGLEGRVGGIITDKDNLLIWPRRVLEHFDIARKFNATIKYAFYGDEDGKLQMSGFSTPDYYDDHERQDEELKNHPRILEMFGKPAKSVELARKAWRQKAGLYQMGDWYEA
jgi:hypothetical protein